MRAELVLSQSDYHIIRNYTLQDQDHENGVVIFCGTNRVKDKIQFLAKDIELLTAADLDNHSNIRLTIKNKKQKENLIRASKAKLSIINCHGHQFAQRAVFSSLDDETDNNLSHFFKKYLPNVYFGSLLFSQNDCIGRFFDKESETLKDIDQIKIFDQPQTVEEGNISSVYDRNVRAFGSLGQARISKTRVIQIGCGGTGWHIAQQLVGMGVIDLVLIDFDLIEQTNLNRLTAAPYSSIGEAKAKVLAKILQSMNPNIRVRYLIGSALDAEALQEIKECDIVIGAVDSDLIRFELNKLAVRYLKPYLDVGTRIFQEDGKITTAGGQVNVIIPGQSPCLACHSQLQWKQIFYEDLEDYEQEFEVNQGYITGINVPAPAVVSINGILSSALVTEFLKLVTGLKKTNYYTYYDCMAENNPMKNIKMKRDPNCLVCHQDFYLAYGDEIAEDNSKDGLNTFLKEFDHEQQRRDSEFLNTTTTSNGRTSKNDSLRARTSHSSGAERISSELLEPISTTGSSADQASTSRTKSARSGYFRYWRRKSWFRRYTNHCK